EGRYTQEYVSGKTRLSREMHTFRCNRLLCYAPDKTHFLRLLLSSVFQRCCFWFSDPIMPSFFPRPEQSLSTGLRAGQTALDRATERHQKGLYQGSYGPQSASRPRPLRWRRAPWAQPFPGGRFRAMGRQGSGGEKVFLQSVWPKYPSCCACKSQRCECRAHTR